MFFPLAIRFVLFFLNLCYVFDLAEELSKDILGRQSDVDVSIRKVFSTSMSARRSVHVITQRLHGG